jgi:alkylated DNA repair dioxygenase AlkB
VEEGFEGHCARNHSDLLNAGKVIPSRKIENFSEVKISDSEDGECSNLSCAPTNSDRARAKVLTKKRESERLKNHYEGPTVISSDADGSRPSVIQYRPTFIDNDIMERVKEEVHFTRKSNGKGSLERRESKWYGPAYSYSKVSLPEDRKIPDSLEMIRRKIETEIFGQDKGYFNSVLCNRYVNGSDAIGQHADDEPELGKNPIIASVSLGAERKFTMKHNMFQRQARAPLGHVINLNLAGGSLLVMKEHTQEFWTHGLDRDLKCKEERINLTFRRTLEIQVTEQEDESASTSEDDNLHETVRASGTQPKVLSHSDQLLVAALEQVENDELDPGLIPLINQLRESMKKVTEHKTPVVNEGNTACPIGVSDLRSGSSSEGSARSSYAEIAAKSRRSKRASAVSAPSFSGTQEPLDIQMLSSSKPKESAVSSKDVSQVPGKSSERSQNKTHRIEIANNVADFTEVIKPLSKSSKLSALELLDDELVGACIKHVACSSNSGFVRASSLKTYMSGLGCQEFSGLIEPGNEENFKWIFVPRCDNGHWTIICSDEVKGVIFELDPLRRKGPGTAPRSRALERIGKEHSRKIIDPPKHDFQPDLVSCGHYVIAFALRLAQGGPLTGLSGLREDLLRMVGVENSSHQAKKWVKAKNVPKSGARAPRDLKTQNKFSGLKVDHKGPKVVRDEGAPNSKKTEKGEGKRRVKVDPKPKQKKVEGKGKVSNSDEPQRRPKEEGDLLMRKKLLDFSGVKAPTLKDKASLRSRNYPTEDGLNAIIESLECPDAHIESVKTFDDVNEMNFSLDGTEDSKTRYLLLRDNIDSCLIVINFREKFVMCIDPTRAITRIGSKQFAALNKVSRETGFAIRRSVSHRLVNFKCDAELLCITYAVLLICGCSLENAYVNRQSLYKMELDEDSSGKRDDPDPGPFADCSNVEELGQVCNVIFERIPEEKEEVAEQPDDQDDENEKARNLQRLFDENSKECIELMRGGFDGKCPIDDEILAQRIKESAGTKIQKGVQDDSEPESESPTTDPKESSKDLPKTRKEDQGFIITPKMVKEALDTEDSAPGPDKLKYSDLLRADPEGIKLAQLYNKCIKFGGVPQRWKVGKVVFIPKAGAKDNPNEPGNWRPLTMLNTVYKIFTKLIARHLTDFAIEMKIIDDAQKAVGGKNGAIENNLYISAIREDSLKEGKSLAMAWLDVADAFNNIDVEAAIVSLEKAGLNPELVEVVRNFQEDAYTKVGKTSVKIERGVRQGCPLSMLLFAIGIQQVINPLVAEREGLGYILHGQRIAVLIYADDLCVIGASRKELQAMLDIITKGANKIGLKFKPQKCGALSQNDSKRSIKVDGTDIREIGQIPYKYLGKEIGLHLFRDDAVDGLLTDVMREIEMIAESQLKPWQKLTAVCRFSLPRLEYALTTCSIKREVLHEFDEKLRKVVKSTMLKVQPRASTNFVHTPCRLGGAGLPSVADNYNIAKVNTLMLGVASSDWKLSHIIKEWLIKTSIIKMTDPTRLSKVFRSRDYEWGEIYYKVCGYLNGYGRVENNNRIGRSYWDDSKQGLRSINTQHKLKIAFTFERDELKLGAEGRYLGSKFLTKRLHDLIANANFEKWCQQRAQGKGAKLYARGGNFLRKGYGASFLGYELCNQARLDLLPVRGHRFEPDSDKSCRHCDQKVETLPHVMQFCQKGNNLRNERHDQILDMVGQMVKKNAGRCEVLIDSANPEIKECPEGKGPQGGALRPDIQVIDRLTNSIRIIDIKCPFETDEKAFTRCHNRNLNHYLGLCKKLSDAGWSVYLETFIVGSCGSWSQHNNRILSTLGISKFHISKMREAIVMKSVRFLKDIWLNHKQGTNKTSN